MDYLVPNEAERNSNFIYDYYVLVLLDKISYFTLHIL